MQVTADVVFVHVPRTGGTFIRRILSTYLPPDPTEPFFKGHVTYEELPERFRDRPSFCVVRNPWDWYVSWYEHAISRGPKLGIERFT